MTTIKKVEKEQALKMAEKASAEIIYDIIKLEGMPFTLQEVQAAMPECKTESKSSQIGRSKTGSKCGEKHLIGMKDSVGDI